MVSNWQHVQMCVFESLLLHCKVVVQSIAMFYCGENVKSTSLVEIQTHSKTFTQQQLSGSTSTTRAGECIGCLPINTAIVWYVAWLQAM